MQFVSVWFFKPLDAYVREALLNLWEWSLFKILAFSLHSELVYWSFKVFIKKQTCILNRELN